MKKIMKFVLLGIVALVVIWTFLFLYSKSQPEIVMYNVVNAKRIDLQKKTVATGKVEPRDEVLIKPQISGIIDKLFKEAGEKVKKGEVIARIKVIPEMGQLNSAENRVRLAELNLKQAKRDWKRTAKLYADRLISKEEYEKGKIKIEEKKEEMRTAQDALEIVRDGVAKRKSSATNTLIRSTIDGLVLDVPVKEGNSVIMSNSFNDGTTIASVANMNDLIFKGNVDETEVGRIKEGMPVKLRIGALQGLEFDANLEYISPKGTESNGATLFEIKAAMHLSDSVKIRSGYSANAEIVLQQAKQALTVPEGVLEFKGDSTFVYKLIETGKPQVFERVVVKTGLSDGVNMQIVEGLKGDEQLRAGVMKEQAMQGAKK
jgi:HlyD family secretion protein